MERSPCDIRQYNFVPKSLYDLHHTTAHGRTNSIICAAMYSRVVVALLPVGDTYKLCETVGSCVHHGGREYFQSKIIKECIYYPSAPFAPVFSRVQFTI